MNPIKAQKLKVLRDKLEALQNPVEDISQFFINEELANISERLKSNPTMKSLQKFNADLTKLQTEVSKLRIDFDFAPLQQVIKQVQKEFKQGQANLMSEFETKLRELPQTPDLTNNLNALRIEFENRIKNLPQPKDFGPDLENIRQQLQEIVTNNIEEGKLEKEEVEKLLAKLRREIMDRINNLGGGSINRQIFIGGADALTKYSDINLKAGSNVTITYTNNNTTKKVDITFAATGGSGSGIVRSINNISSDTTAAASSTTDYVYLISGTTTLTLPDATTNTNLYTVKNVGTGVVTINTTSSQTIDGSLTIVMPVQFTSVDLISDSANWNVT